MRYLIAGDDLAVSNLTNQQRFFNRHLRGWADVLCDALEATRVPISIVSWLVSHATSWRSRCRGLNCSMVDEAQAFLRSHGSANSFTQACTKLTPGDRFGRANQNPRLTLPAALLDFYGKRS
jgi:hypothetical protein